MLHNFLTFIIERRAKREHASADPRYSTRRRHHKNHESGF